MIWFTADHHFGHKNIIEYCHRPFADVDHMNTEFIRRWNERVHPDDAVFILGDFAMGKIVETLPIALQLNGHKTLLLGNHDRPWMGNDLNEEKQYRWVGEYHAAGFEELIHFPMAHQVGSHNVIMNHFPYSGDSHDQDRFTQYRPQNTGRILLHGHVHDKWKTNGPMVNVGVDMWDYAPVSSDELLELLDRRFNKKNHNLIID